MARQVKRIRGAIVTLACGVAAVAGCRTAVSTHVIPNPFCGGWDTKKIRGIPVTVKVPTHLELHVIERTYLQPGSFIPIQTSRFVENIVREKDQLFFVDSVRPAAGTMTHNATLSTTQQFFSGYNTKIQDTTINDITGLLPKLVETKKALKDAKAIADSAQTPPRAEDVEKMLYVDHMVAVKVFDVNTPMLTDDVRDFLALYMNCTNGCIPPAAAQ